jgi:hypothetical protein
VIVSHALSNNHLTIKRAIERGVRGNKPFLETEPLYLGSGVAKRQPGKGVSAASEPMLQAKTLLLLMFVT